MSGKDETNAGAETRPREWRVGRFYVREGAKRPARVVRVPARWTMWAGPVIWAALVLSIGLRHGLTWKQAPLIVAAAAMVGGAVMKIVAVRRVEALKRELEAAEYRVCPTCRYDLRGIEAERGVWCVRSAGPGRRWRG